MNNTIKTLTLAIVAVAATACATSHPAASVATLAYTYADTPSTPTTTLVTTDPVFLIEDRTADDATVGCSATSRLQLPAMVRSSPQTSMMLPANVTVRVATADLAPISAHAGTPRHTRVFLDDGHAGSVCSWDYDRLRVEK